MDPLTDLLSAIRVQSVCHGRLNAGAPWGLRFDAAPYAIFSLVSQGGCWLEMEGLDQPVRLASGDFLLLAPERRFTLRHDLRDSVQDFDDVLRQRLRAALSIGGGGTPFTMVCGKFVFGDADTRPLADLLPPLIHLRCGESVGPALKTTLDLLAVEAASETSTSKLVLNRLADVLFIQAVRAYLESPQAPKPAWFGALADQQIGASLRSMHDSLDRAWTVAELATEARMSRSGYAQRFKELLGEAPLEHLTRWRMYRASRLLQETDSKILDVAQAVGYDSDGAFYRAFKRVIGVAPGEYRRNNGERAAAQ